jgi:DNA-binding transcriptional ArsR family regulator
MANFKEIEITMKALGNMRRLAILRYIRSHKESSVGELAGDARISIQATSKNLSVLTKADILDREQRGMQAYFFLSPTMPDIAKRIVSSL